MLLRPVRTRNVRQADSRASATANGASQRRADQRRGSSAGAVSKDAAEVSALVIPAMGAENGVRGGRILMYSYHIVAELRQFRGVPAATDPRIHSDMPEGGNGFRPRQLDQHAQILSRNDGVGRAAADRGGGSAGQWSRGAGAQCERRQRDTASRPVCQIGVRPGPAAEIAI